MYILGINAYHAGSAACLINNGKLVAAAEEERFNRRKYWAGFPVQSIQYVLGEAGITAYDLDHIGLSRDPSANLFKKVLYTLSKRPSRELVRERLATAAEVRDTRSIFLQALGLDAKSLRAEFHNVEHHRAHLASAFYVSPFSEAAIFSVDGMGDFISTMLGSGKNAHIQAGKAIHFPHSLGFFYTAVSQWLGFPRYGDEGKVMGLSAYGEPAYIDKMRKIVRLQRDGAFALDLDYFVIHTDGVSMSWDDGDPVLGNLYSSKLTSLFGEPRQPRSEITRRHMDVASSLQAMLEEAEFALLRKLQRETGQKALCMAGGVALNSAFNGKVLPETDFEDIFIQPAAGDAGTAMGVCYYIWHQLLNQPRNFVLADAYTGPQYTNGRVESVLKKNSLSYQALDEQALVDQAASMVADGKILGWYQGRMEWGPRALGNRSIIADPRREDIKDVLNARVKNREKFRPFAPSIQQEYVGDYFDQTYPDPFMIKVYNVLPEKRKDIPAVTHVDGSGRLQTVDRQAAPLYWSLIEAFRQRTGVPVVLNTSFNENEPIVCTPEEAVDCFLRTNMDVLALGNYLIQR